jgi:hypothetical protein
VSRLWTGLLLGVLALAGACRQDPAAVLKKDPTVLGIVGRYAVTRKDYNAALDFNQAGATQDALVQSRIWDRLVNSLLVLNDLALDPPPSWPVPLGSMADPKVREDAVTSALQDRVYSKVSVSADQVAVYYREHQEDFKRGPGALVREMLLPGEALARDAERLLRRGHSFVDVARLYSLSPDRGTARYFQYDEIPDYLLAAVKKTRVGVPSSPILVSTDSYQIIMVERRFDAFTLPLQEVAPEIRLRLTDEKGDQLYHEYMEGLRGRFRLVVFYSKLPFVYEKETP